MLYNSSYENKRNQIASTILLSNVQSERFHVSFDQRTMVQFWNTPQNRSISAAQLFQPIDFLKYKVFEEIYNVLNVNRNINLNILGAVVDIIGIGFQGATDRR